MIRYASICLVLFTVSTALAQQAAEWRPNISEDNKTATWEDTGRFLSDRLTDAEWHTEGDWFNVVSANTSTSCKVTIHQRIQSNELNCGRCSVAFKHMITDINLKVIDPLSVYVVPSVNPLSAGRVVLHLSTPTKNEAIQTSIMSFSTYRGKFDIQAFEKQMLEKCQTAIGGCDKSQDVTRDFAIGDFDVDTGHRLARGFMHAAILCGGTKSVSPF